MNIQLKSADYVINHNIEDILKTIPSLGLPIILTPHKSESSDINFVQEVYKKNKTGFIKITPRSFLENIEKFSDYKYLMVEDTEIMEYFGYTESIKKIRKLGYHYIFMNIHTKDYLKYSDSVTHLSFNKFSINCSKEDVFVSVYVLYKNYKNVVVVCKNIKKMEMFCKILGMECTVTDEYSSKFADKICLVVDKYIEINTGKVVYIGFNLGFRRISLNMNKMGKISYRIKDLLKYLTKDVVNGKKIINLDRFKNIDT
ncbi:hypothetical protein P3W45_000705 [Vairimorpha bombi]|jgi:hypothetical protein